MQIPGADILWPELMSEGKETLLEKMKANGTLFEFNFILLEFFISEWTLSLRECDIQAINKSVQSQLYADILQKPSEAIMCRSIHQGGLGVTSIRYRAKAYLIRNFCELKIQTEPALL